MDRTPDRRHRPFDCNHSDSTHLKASANKNWHDLHQVAQTPAAYLAELEVAIDIYPKKSS